MAHIRWVGIAAIVIGLLVAGASVIPLSRASETGARVESHLAKAEELSREAETVKESDPARYEQLTQEIEKWNGFASTDLDEESTQRTAGLAMAAGGGGFLIGGVIVVILLRRRPAFAQGGLHQHGGDSPKKPQYR
ncbi:hypothetical protein ACFFMN_22560 [Planobispora siamensis]|uniref:Uncharacterized protein n=1 Tax=Planobispora siamensis TaxID=936338 RepID=A0A8J3WN90_9ACTN|nr:hypothetical protein [Planobispora siamensis]GIH94217.1 hypothetical protein Psi01_48470 [Planobispora siamensis]